MHLLNSWAKHSALICRVFVSSISVLPCRAIQKATSVCSTCLGEGFVKVKFARNSGLLEVLCYTLDNIPQPLAVTIRTRNALLTIRHMRHVALPGT